VHSEKPMDWRDIPSEKFIGWQPIASEMDAQLRRATSAMRERLNSVPRIVELAFTNHEFREGGFQELTDVAKSIGVVYEIDKLYVRDGWAATAEQVRGRLSTLGADSSIHGIRVHTAYAGGRDKPFEVDWVDPLKDINCITSTCNRWLRSGEGPFVFPTTGAILKVLSYGLKGRPLTEVSVALLKGGGHPYSSYALTLLEVVLRCRSVTTYVDPGPDDAERIRRADVIVSQVGKQSYLDGRYVREGQIVIDDGGAANGNWEVRTDADLDSVIPVIGAYAHGSTVSYVKLRMPFLNAMRTFLLKQGGRIASQLMPLVEIV
jgi:5,10-methylene-tetrahydrofolate dehydrogenase/methenyl tetrahydrofolate cyclohydrolase